MKDYYALLGISRTASTEEIKRAFRRLAVRYHPDKNQDPGAEETFKEINQAYDVLGDWEKRKQYDLRWENPFSVATFEPERQRAQDPRYRRRRPPGYRPPAPAYTSRDLMRDYLPWMRMVSYTGLVFAILIYADLVLPYSEHIQSIEQVKTREANRTSNAFMFVTEDGHRIRVYNYDARYLLHEERIRFSETMIFRTVMRVSDVGPTLRVNVAYIYRTLFFFPLILLGSSLGGSLYRKNVEVPFNLSIVSGIFLILTAGLIIVI